MVNVACQSKKAMGETPNACSTIKVGIHQHFLVFYSPVVFFSHFCLMEILVIISANFTLFFMTKNRMINGSYCYEKTRQHKSLSLETNIVKEVYIFPIVKLGSYQS